MKPSNLPNREAPRQWACFITFQNKIPECPANREARGARWAP
jgi:hypothetical protein